MDYIKEFLPGSYYKIYNFELGKYEVLSINSRNGSWVNITVNNRTVSTRVLRIYNPKAESLLLDGFCPIYSYDKDIKNEYK